MHVCYDWCIVVKNFEFEIEFKFMLYVLYMWNYSLYNYTPLPYVDKTMSFFPHYAPFFCFLHPQNEMFSFV